MNIKSLMIAVLSLPLSGCWYCTTRVSEMGLRGARITGMANGECKIQTIAIVDFNYYGFNLPYSYSRDFYAGRVVETKIGSWAIKDSTLVIQSDDGVIVRRPNDVAEMLNPGICEPPSRRWWSYPSQLLQLVAIPVDVVTGPFILVYHAIADRPQIGP